MILRIVKNGKVLVSIEVPPDAEISILPSGGEQTVNLTPARIEPSPSTSNAHQFTPPAPERASVTNDAQAPVASQPQAQKKEDVEKEAVESVIEMRKEAEQSAENLESLIESVAATMSSAITNIEEKAPVIQVSTPKEKDKKTSSLKDVLLDIIEYSQKES